MELAEAVDKILIGQGAHTLRIDKGEDSVDAVGEVGGG